MPSVSRKRDWFHAPQLTLANQYELGENTSPPLVVLESLETQGISAYSQGTVCISIRNCDPWHLFSIDSTDKRRFRKKVSVIFVFPLR